MTTQRPTAVTVAAVLLALFSCVGLIGTLVPAFSEGVPAVVVYGGTVLGAIGLAAAYGLLRLKRWSVRLAVVVSLLNALSAAPGIAFAPTAPLLAGAIVTVLGFALIIFLVALPHSRRAYA